MARIVNEAHFDRLSGLLKQTKGQVVHGGELDKDELKIGITIVQGVTKDDSLMSDEIFGPLLPVLRVDNLNQAISLIRQSETPLAMYPHLLICANTEKVISSPQIGALSIPSWRNVHPEQSP